MKRKYIEVIAELMVVNELPELMKEVESELYNNEYLTFEAHVFNAGAVFSDVIFVNDILGNDWLNEAEYLFRVEEVVEYREAIQATYNEFINGGY